MSGHIVGASLVLAPKPLHKAGEEKALKAGRIVEACAAKPAKLGQMERDARFTLVFGKTRRHEAGTRHAGIAIPILGWQSHAGSNQRHGVIRQKARDRGEPTRWSDAAAGAARPHQCRHDRLDRQRLLRRGKPGLL